MEVHQVDPEHEEVGLGHGLAISVLVDIPKQLFTGLSVHIVEVSDLVRVSLLDTPLANMVS